MRDNRIFILGLLFFVFASYIGADLQPKFYVDIDNLNENNRDKISSLRDNFKVASKGRNSFIYMNSKNQEISCNIAARKSTERDQFYNEIFICTNENLFLEDIFYLKNTKVQDEIVFLSFNSTGWGIALEELPEIKEDAFFINIDGEYHSPKTTEGGKFSRRAIGLADYSYEGALKVEEHIFTLNPENIVPAADRIADMGGSLAGGVGDLIEEVPDAITDSKTAYGVAGCLAGGAAGGATGAIVDLSTAGATLGGGTVIGAAIGCAGGAIFGYTNSSELDNKQYCSIYVSPEINNFPIICENYKIEVNDRTSQFDGKMKNPFLGYIQDFETFIKIDFPSKDKSVTFCKSKYDNCDLE